MSENDKPAMHEYQPSLSEWFSAAGGGLDAEVFREEDNRKSNRLKILSEIINLPFERPRKFPAQELRDPSPAFAEFLQASGDKLCAIRLVPSLSELPKLRNRGLPLKDCYENWFLKQDIDLSQYTAEIYDHVASQRFSLTLIVNASGIFGEIVSGMHAQLTHGDTLEEPTRFMFDFTNWIFSKSDLATEQEVRRVVAALCVSDAGLRQVLETQLQSHFTHNYLHGYFEAVVWPTGELYFIDFNRLLPQVYSSAPVIVSMRAAGDLSGTVASPGLATGRVVIVSPETLASVTFSAGDILVCENTDVRYLPLMQRAGAIVTSRGAMLSHAAIVARELKKPCLVGVKQALTSLQTGDQVSVDAETGIVRKL